MIAPVSSPVLPVLGRCVISRSPFGVGWARTRDGAYIGCGGRAEISDNGGGMGPSRDAGRWALLIDGEWVSNVDTLPAAKAEAESRCR